MSNQPTAPVRLKDIARDLNVSVMTVSKVVRGCADVGAETRSRVLARIKELNYQPNWVARSLAARRTFMIGLIVPDLMHSFFAEIAKGVSAAIRPLGYDVVICNSEEDAAVEASEVERLLGRQIDGLVLASSQSASDAEVFQRMDARNIPYVLIDRRFPDLQAPYVGADDEAIGRLATAHLLERGCRRIAHIAAQQRPPGLGRLKGYRDALEAANIAFNEAYVAAGDGAAPGRNLRLQRSDGRRRHESDSRARPAHPAGHQSDRRGQRPLFGPVARAPLHDRSKQRHHRTAGRGHSP
jgi:LacI family transcriptional regulator